MTKKLKDEETVTKIVDTVNKKADDVEELAKVAASEVVKKAVDDLNNSMYKPYPRPEPIPFDPTKCDTTVENFNGVFDEIKEGLENFKQYFAQAVLGVETCRAQRNSSRNWGYGWEDDERDKRSELEKQIDSFGYNNTMNGISNKFQGYTSRLRNMQMSIQMAPNLSSEDKDVLLNRVEKMHQYMQDEYEHYVDRYNTTIAKFNEWRYQGVSENDWNTKKIADQKKNDRHMY